ncbi:hypothetical protein ACFE04_007573 [Oxalis oulophora]
MANNENVFVSLQRVRYECQSTRLLTLNTLDIIIRRYEYRRVHSNRVSTTLHDNSEEEYAWLRDGWVCEKRTMEGPRVYKYYYDPQGNFYKTKKAVKQFYDLHP